MDRKQQELESYTSALSENTDGRRRSALSQAQRTAQIMYDQDAEQFTTYVKKKQAFLHDAISMFARCLILSDDHDEDAVIRLCSLWFSNFSDENLNKYIDKSINPIPSRKFIFLAHQLAARLSAATDNSNSSGSQSALQALMLRLCREHPFHSLYQVYALRGGRRVVSRRNSMAVDESQDARIRAATNLLNSLRGKSLEGERLSNIEKVCDAYVQWATYPIKKENSQDKTRTVPDNLQLIKLHDIPVPVSTMQTPVDPSCKYETIVGISHYSPKYTTAGGCVIAWPHL